MFYWIALAIAFLFAVIPTGCSPPGGAGDSSHAASGKTVASVDLLMLGLPDPAAADSTAHITQLESRPTMLHFWGTWCGPCRIEYPELAEMMGTVDPQRCQFLSISCEAGADDDYQSLTDQTDEFLQELNISTTVYCDPTGQTRTAIASALGNVHMSYPTTVIVDANHRIVGVWEGFSPEGVGEMKRAIDQLSATDQTVSVESKSNKRGTVFSKSISADSIPDTATRAIPLAAI